MFYMFDNPLHNWEMDSELAHILINLLNSLQHIHSNCIAVRVVLSYAIRNSS